MLENDFNFSGTLSYANDRISTVGYCFYVASTLAIQIICVYLLLKNIDRHNPNFANKFSLTTIAICNIEDFYQTLTHIEYILTS